MLNDFVEFRGRRKHSSKDTNDSPSKRRKFENFANNNSTRFQRPNSDDVQYGLVKIWEEEEELLVLNQKALDNGFLRRNAHQQMREAVDESQAVNSSPSVVSIPESTFDQMERAVVPIDPLIKSYGDNQKRYVPKHIDFKLNKKTTLFDDNQRSSEETSIKQSNRAEFKKYTTTTTTSKSQTLNIDAVARCLQKIQELRVRGEEYQKKVDEEVERKRQYNKKKREEEKRREFETYETKRLSTEQEKLVSSVFRLGFDSDTISESFNLQLHRSDLKRLQGTNWLNDEVINFYMELLKKRGMDEGEERGYPKCHFFNTFFYALLTKNGGYDYSRVRKWTNKLNLFEFDKVFVPINEHQNHWTLAVINFSESCFQYYDSFQSENYQCLKKLRRYLEDEMRDKKKEGKVELSKWREELVKEIPNQRNGYDCGVFMCKFADFASKEMPFFFSQDHMPYFRKRIALEIITKQLLPP